MAGTIIPYDQAKETNDKLNALEPPITYAEQARLAYAVTSYANPQGATKDERDYYSVWADCEFSQNCKNLGDMMLGYPGSWAQMVRNEYNAWMQSHQKAAQYGLPEGMTWYFVDED